MSDQLIVYAVMLGALVMFVKGTWRYDIVAVAGLLILTLTGVVPAESAFSGLGDPVVVTVASVLVVSRALVHTGVVDRLASILTRAGNSPIAQVGSLTFLVTAISGFLSSVAAVAILMPVAIRMSRRAGRPVSILLMPLAFGALLGAQITLIGSAPNLLVSRFRAEAGLGSFSMFDYSRVGGLVALGGVLFISLIGWRLIPHRKGATSPEDLFKIGEYLFEVRVPESSKWLGTPIGELEEKVEGEMTVVAIIRGDERIAVPSQYIQLRELDELVVECDSPTVESLVEKTGFTLIGTTDEDLLGAEEIGVAEAVVTATSRVVGRTAVDLDLRRRYGLNLLAVARGDHRITERLGRSPLRAGDVLLLQGRGDNLQETLSTLGCLPLAQRGLRLTRPTRIIAAVSILLGALILSATGTLSVHIAFSLAAIATVVTGLLPVREAYAGIEGSVVVLLAAMIPIGRALETTGGAEQIANAMLRFADDFPAEWAVALILISTMFLSDLINNAAAAILMAPIALRLAIGLGVSPDPLLMAVAVGASCAFLTPIGHQTNTIVYGPGGYRFGDFWKLGAPLELLIAVTAVPAILIFWPLS